MRTPRHGRACRHPVISKIKTVGQGLNSASTQSSGGLRLTRRSGRRWPRELLDQLTQPLAILLAVAAVLAWVGGTPALSVAVLAVVVLNAGFAFVQERQAERAVDALALDVSR